MDSELREQEMSNLAENFEKYHKHYTRRWIAENTVTNPRYPSLMPWSWQSIQKVYAILGTQLNDYKEIADRFELDLPLKPKPGETIRYADGNTDFIRHFYVGVHRINEHLRVLDAEIARRNQLVGVMG